MANSTMQEVANYLLNHCFLMGSVEETRERYYYALNHMTELNNLFRPLGYTVVPHHTPLKVIALVNEYEGGQARLRKYESILLLIFRLLYLQKRETLSVDGDQIIVTVEELQNEFQKLNLPKKLDQVTLEAALRTLKSYNLVRPLERLNELSARIEVYPSVILALPDNILRATAELTEKELAKYQRSEGEEE